MICHRCGAGLGDEERLYCLHCGARQAGGIGDPEAYRLHPERFALTERQPAFAAAMRWRPRLSASRELGTPLAMLAFGCGLGAAASLLFAQADEDAIAIAWFSVLGLFALVCVYQVALSARRVLAPTVATVSVIVADEARADTLAPHAVTLALADGGRRSLLGHGAVMNLVEVGDIGVAYAQRDRLVDFRWFDVMPAAATAGALARPPSCPQCAAPATIDTVAACLFCGAALPAPDLGEHGARLAAVARDPAARAALAGDERATAIVLPSLQAPLVLLGLGALGLYGAWVYRVLFFLAYDHWPWGLAFLLPPLALFSVGAVWLRRRATLHFGPKQRVAARVVRVRDVVTVTVNGAPAQRRIFVTIASASGGRVELRCLAPVASVAVTDAVGVAHVRGEWLAAFTAVDA